MVPQLADLVRLQTEHHLIVEAVDGLHGPLLEVQVRGILNPTEKSRKAMRNPITHFLIVG